MGEIIIKADTAISLGSIDGEEDLKPRKGIININPPPADGKCNCCGRHINELKPFGKAGDPLVGDFDGALLVKKYRTALPPPDPETQEIFDRFIGNREPGVDYDKAKKLLVQEFGAEDAETIELRVYGGDQVGSSWECRDCAILDMYEFFEKVGYDLEEYYAWKPRRKVERGVTPGNEPKVSGFLFLH